VDYNHILIRFDESKADPAPAIAHLAAVRDSVVSGQLPFDLAARRNSQDQFSRQMGGNVTDPQTGDRRLIVTALGPYWQRTLNGMEAGDISEPAEVDLQDGRQAWHIVLLQDRIPAHTLGLDSDYALIRQYAQRDKEARVMSQWLSELRAMTYIDIRADVSQNAPGTF